MDKKHIEYVIGIDLGHGETAAAICALQWDTPEDQLDAGKDLEMEPNCKVLPSAITIVGNGTAKIGKAAFDPNILKNAHVHVCFKKKPVDINGEAEQIMIRFMQEVYRKIRENAGGQLTDTNHLVYIATPSGWDKAAQDLYFQMACKAGIPMGGITKESRAAFVRAQHDPTANLGRNIEKGAIVFDMGSSTLDFTYHKKGLSKMVDNGYDCGASFVEKSMYKALVEDSDAIKMFVSRYPKLQDFLLFEVRRAKEDIYSDTTRKYKKTVNFEDIVDDDDLEDERFRVTYEPGQLTDTLHKNGYIQSIREAMRDYLSQHISGESIYGVFLTGGASRMDFIKELVSECWNVPADKIFRDQDPSLTISQGIAEVARADLRTKEANKDVAALLKDISGDKIYDTFVSEFNESLSNHLISRIHNAIINWRDSQKDLNINNLSNEIKSAIELGMNNGTNTANDWLSKAITEHTEDFRNKIDSIVAAYTAEGVNISMPKLDNTVKLDNITDINMSDIMRQLANSVEIRSSVWIGTLTGASIGAAIALIFGGPLTWLVGAAALFGSNLVRDEESRTTKKAKAMSKKTRHKRTNSNSAFT